MVIVAYKILLMMIFLSSIESVKRLRLREIRCETTGKSIVDKFCYIKTYKRFSFYSAGFNLTRKLENLKWTFGMERKSQSGNYEKVFSMDDVDFCKIVEGKEISMHSSILLAVNYLKQFGNLEDACTKSSSVIKMTNVTFDSFPVLQTLPNSEYMWRFNWHDDIDEKILYLRLFGNIV